MFFNLQPFLEHGPKLGVGLMMVVYLVACPYTKVEESFNMQAIHDICYHGLNFSSYDHHMFPGVVPRSFIGPLVVSFISYPSVNFITQLVGGKLLTQYLVRFWIGCLFLFGMCKFTSGVHHTFGREVSQYFIFITLTQFHYLFYASRSLPNTFALILALIAIGSWLKKNVRRFIWFSAFAIIIFRFELCILMGICLCLSLLQGHICVKRAIFIIIPAGISAISLTILVDSFLWERFLWPEGEVMWFNVVLNKSGEWGTSPAYWYFTSALPRSLLATSIFIPWGFRSDPIRCSRLLVPALGFVLAFSLLPHKELRFIIYVIPLFNVLAAKGCANIKLRSEKSSKWKLIYIVTTVCLVANVAASLIFLSASMRNYPGGEMMKLLHQKVSCSSSVRSTPVHVHISNYAAQTGVTRFTEVCSLWRYNKTENLNLETLQNDRDVSHVIAEYGSERDRLKFSETHVNLGTTSAFTGISLRKTDFLFGFPFLHLKTTPALTLWQRKSFRS